MEQITDPLQDYGKLLLSTLADLFCKTMNKKRPWPQVGRWRARFGSWGHRV